VKGNDDSSWASVLRDVQSCGLRNNEPGPRPAPHHASPHEEEISPAPKPMQRTISPGLKERPEDGSPAGLIPDDGSELGPFSEALPRGLVERFAKLMLKEDPYIAREIGERASGCLRLQFLKQCKLGYKDRCASMWGLLSERERRDLYRACQCNHFALNIMEADTDCGESSFGDRSEEDSEVWSDASGSPPDSTKSFPAVMNLPATARSDTSASPPDSTKSFPVVMNVPATATSSLPVRRRFAC